MRSASDIRRRKWVYTRDLLRELVTRDLKVRYNSSVLGVLFSLTNPILQLLVLNFLFNKVMPLGIPRYPVFALSGVLVFLWFQSSIVQAAGSVTVSRELIKKPGFPAAILPIVAVSTNFIHFLLALPILFIVMISNGVTPVATILMLPVVMALQFVMTLSFAYLVAPANVIFRDTQYLLQAGLQIVFFMTPVFYNASAVPAKYQWIYFWNPMAHLIAAYRAILLEHSRPDLLTLLVLALISVVLLTISLKIFHFVSYRFVEEL